MASLTSKKRVAGSIPVSRSRYEYSSDHGHDTAPCTPRSLCWARLRAYEQCPAQQTRFYSGKLPAAFRLPFVERSLTVRSDQFSSVTVAAIESGLSCVSLNCGVLAQFLHFANPRPPPTSLDQHRLR